MVGSDGIGGQQPIRLLQPEGVRESQAELCADRRGRLLADPFAGDSDPQRVPCDPCHFPEGCPRGPCLLNSCAEVDFARVFQVGADPGFFEVSIKLVEVAGTQIFELNVANGLIDPHKVFLVLGVGLDLELLPGEVIHPDLGEVLEADIPVFHGAGVDPLLK